MEDYKVIYINDKLYPKKLLKIKNPPQQLYVMGNIELLNKDSIAIIGSRKCTDYGEKQAAKFSRQISNSDVCIVSGLAKGIDTIAHLNALCEKGRTIAVLGSGFNKIYPKDNIDLIKDILKNQGCIITEYSPNICACSYNFVNRNRIVSGLSNGVLVVEAKYRSGTSITANFAKSQGKKVYCIPSNLDSKAGYGTGKLIQNGAKLVLSVNDILEDLGYSKKNIETEKVVKYKIEVDEEYREIYNSIQNIPINIDDICKKTKKNVSEVNIALTMLELQGVIVSISGNSFIRK